MAAAATAATAEMAAASTKVEEQPPDKKRKAGEHRVMHQLPGIEEAYWPTQGEYEKFTETIKRRRMGENNQAEYKRMMKQATNEYEERLDRWRQLFHKYPKQVWVRYPECVEPKCVVRDKGEKMCTNKLHRKKVAPGLQRLLSSATNITSANRSRQYELKTDGKLTPTTTAYPHVWVRSVLSGVASYEWLPIRAGPEFGVTFRWRRASTVIERWKLSVGSPKDSTTFHPPPFAGFAETKRNKMFDREVKPDWVRTVDYCCRPIIQHRDSIDVDDRPNVVELPCICWHSNITRQNTDRHGRSLDPKVIGHKVLLLNNTERYLKLIRLLAELFVSTNHFPDWIVAFFVDFVGVPLLDLDETRDARVNDFCVY